MKRILVWAALGSFFGALSRFFGLASKPVILFIGAGFVFLSLYLIIAAVFSASRRKSLTRPGFLGGWLAFLFASCVGLAAFSVGYTLLARSDAIRTLLGIE